MMNGEGNLDQSLGGDVVITIAAVRIAHETRLMKQKKKKERHVRQLDGIHQIHKHRPRHWNWTWVGSSPDNIHDEINLN
jgi:hypothetical protein